MHKKIFAALDGSPHSNLAISAALSLHSASSQSELIGCHVYAAELHRERFEQMEPGLPERYQEEEKLDSLRSTHEDLITDGMKLIADSYLAPLASAVQERGLSCKGLAPEGRNYVELLKAIKTHLPELVILGAAGHGMVPESNLGSLTERTLLNAHHTDILIIQQPWKFKYRPIVVGIDGSQESYAALQRAIMLAKAFDAELEAVSVYDPFFHTGVFQVISEALPEADKEKFDFNAQEQLHDEIIDSGLEKLYQEGLDRGEKLAHQLGVQIKTEVLAGKVFSQIHHYAQLRNAGLIVMGRWGLHRERSSLIGSNTHNLARITNCNLLVTSPPDNPIEIPQLPQEDNQQTPLKWTPDASESLKRIPFFARSMARRSIEQKAREQGLDTVSADFVRSISDNMGMGKR